MVDWLVDGFIRLGDYGREGELRGKRGTRMSFWGEKGLASLVVGRQPLPQAVLRRKKFFLLNLQRRRDYIGRQLRVCARMQVDKLIPIVLPLDA